MKRFTSFIIAGSLLCASLFCNAQKKVTLIAQSALTGVVLPQGSKQDGRFLPVAAAKMLLEMESKKSGATVNTVEVLMLPSVAASNFNSDSLVTQLTGLGWNIIPVQGDDKFVWLQKDSRYIITYLSMDKKETNLYFGEAATAPSLPSN